MARELETFEWPTLGQRPGRAQKYPWDQWLNGKPWELEHGTDYTCKTTSILHAAKKKLDAEQPPRAFKWVRTGEKTIVIQAVAAPAAPADDSVQEPVS